MDWTRAIAVNQKALSRLLAEIIALLDWAGGTPTDRLPRAVHAAALRLLRPAESALRRLIVIAAHGLTVKLPPPHPMPKGLKIVATGSGPVRFVLYDRRKTFSITRIRYTKASPRIHFFGPSPLVPVFAAPQQPTPSRDPSISAASLFRRLTAAQHALATIPTQALRLARWTARRARMEKAKFSTPLRPGPPPGHRAKGREDADMILKECHALAQDLLRADSS